MAITFAQFANGQERPPWTLSGCIKAALTQSADLNAARADLHAAGARLAQAKSARFGELEYTQIGGVVNEAKGDPTSSTTNRNDVVNGLGPFTRLDFEWRLPIWTFGRLEAALAAAESAMSSEAAAGEVTKSEVVLNTRRLYFGVLLSRQIAHILHDMLDAIDKAERKLSKQLADDEKSVSELDYLKLKIGRARFAKGVFEVDASAELAQRALGRAVGLSHDTEIEIADVKLEPVRVEVAPVDSYLHDASLRRPEQRQLKAGLSAAAARVEMERGGYFPSLFVIGGVRYAYAPNRERQTNPFANEEFNYWSPVAAAGIRWDLGFLRTRARVEEARSELAKVRVRASEAESGVRLEIRKAHAEVIRAQKTIEATDVGRRAGRALLVLAVSNFDLGIGDGQELFTDLGLYVEANADYFHAVHDFNVAVGMLSRAVGREITDLEY